MRRAGGNAEHAPEIPDKLYFRIGEVSRMVGVPAHVLRYWEKEFPALAPRKSGREHRLYRRKDLELLLEIKHLLHDKRYTIEGARRFLEKRGAAPPPRREPPRAAAQGSLFADPAALAGIRKELTDLLDLLK